MEKITSQNLISALNWRYAVKKFDSNKKIAPELWQTLKESLVLTPSSFGLQPWKFICLTSSEIKAQLPEFSWNQTQPKDCSHFVVLCARTDVDAAYIEKFISRTCAVRGVQKESLKMYQDMILGFANNAKSQGWMDSWVSKQCYIALGNLMTSAAVLGIDACPMEGIDAAKYDQVLKLEGSGFKTVVACALGYRADDDAYALAKKVRFEANELVVEM